MFVKLYISFTTINSTPIILLPHLSYKTIIVKDILSTDLELNNLILNSDINGLGFLGLVNRPHTFSSYTATRYIEIGYNNTKNNFTLSNLDGTRNNNTGNVFILLEINS